MDNCLPDNTMDDECSLAGEVIGVDGDSVTVLVETSQGCGSCGIGFICRGKTKEEVLSVSASGRGLDVGDKVLMTATSRLRRSALALGIGYPCALMIVLLALTLSLGAPQSLSACAALIGVAAYYFALYCFRHRLGRLRKWRIVKK